MRAVAQQETPLMDHISGALRLHMKGNEMTQTSMPLDAKAMTVEDMKAAARKPAPYTDAHLASLSSEHRMVSPQEAKDLRQACLFSRQRSLRSDHIRRLACEMERGWFLQGTPIWLCVLPDKSMLLVNGNHTLEAVAEAGINVPLTIIYQQVADEDEAAAAYACFDIQRTRGWTDAARAVGADEGLANAGKILAAMVPIMLGFEPRSAGRTDQSELLSRRLRFALLEEYRTAALLLHGACSGAPHSNQLLMLRSGVYSVALVTARYQPATAEEFWGGMVFDDGLRANDPRKALLKFLQARPVEGRMSRHAMSMAAANSWNAHFEGRTLAAPRPGLNVRFTLLGTPWAKPSREAPALPVNGGLKLGLGAKLNGRGGRSAVAVYQS